MPPHEAFVGCEFLEGTALAECTHIFRAILARMCPKLDATRQLRTDWTRVAEFNAMLGRTSSLALCQSSRI
jgi:hypothetical protein